MRPLYPLIIAIVSFGFFLPVRGTEKDWRSPCVLSASQKAIISKWITKQGITRECALFGERTFLIRYDNHRIGAFAIGDSFEPVVQQGEGEFLDSEKVYKDTGQAMEIFHELKGIWYSPASLHRLSSEELSRADMLVQKLFATASINDIQPAIYNAMGLRGNRYLPVIDRLTSLLPEAAIAFYEGYIAGSMLNISAEDAPSDQDKQRALERVVQIFEVMDINAKYHFAFDVSQEIKRVDRNSYLRLKQYGVITEGESE